MKELSQKKSIIIRCAILAVYAVVTLIGALNHELWFDEAQAWNIARDNDIAGIIGMMRYEGHPPLWHFILVAFSHMGLSCDILPLISWAFMTCTAAVVLFKLPLSLPLQAAVVFSGGFIFTNSVVSRVYCLVPFLLCLIAVMYPKRKKHPVVFGLLVGLLANTHVCFSGMVGILGIFMIVDLAKGWRESSASENTFGVIGLLASGVGVLMLVLPLLGSLSANRNTAEMSLDLPQMINSAVQGLFNVSVNSLSISGDINILVSLGTVVVQACIILMLVLLRHHRRAFAAELTFLLLYIATGEVIFYTNPNRAAIVLFSFVFAIAIAAAEQPVYKPHRELKTDTVLIKRLLDLIVKCDSNAIKTYELLLTVSLVLTIPSGVMYLFQDYSMQFSPARKTAEYIAENLPEDAVFVTASDFLPQISTYLPEVKLYSVEHSDFYTYSSHMVTEGELDYAAANADLAQYSHVYELNCGYIEDYIPDDEAVFCFAEGMAFSANIGYIEIVPFER